VLSQITTRLGRIIRMILLEESGCGRRIFIHHRSTPAMRPNHHEAPMPQIKAIIHGDRLSTTWG